MRSRVSVSTVISVLHLLYAEILRLPLFFVKHTPYIAIMRENAGWFVRVGALFNEGGPWGGKGNGGGSGGGSATMRRLSIVADN
jgi:hypothetical protein